MYEIHKCTQNSVYSTVLFLHAFLYIIHPRVYLYCSFMPSLTPSWNNMAKEYNVCVRFVQYHRVHNNPVCSPVLFLHAQLDPQLSQPGERVHQVGPSVPVVHVLTNLQNNHCLIFAGFCIRIRQWLFDYIVNR